MEARISGTTKLFGLIGSPVSHSASPAMQNYGFQACGVDGAYLAFDIKEEEVPEFVKSMRLLNIQGCNVTMPNKTAAAQNMDELSPAAELIGAVNTVVQENGVLTGFNTDGKGYMTAVTDAGFDIIGKKMTLLGTGGAAASIITQAALDGVPKIDVIARKGNSWNAVEQVIHRVNSRTDCKVCMYELKDEVQMRKSIDESAILINASSVGMSPHEEGCLVPDVSYFHPELIVSDVIYQPRKTRLLQMAESVGCPTFNGMYMLLYQGAYAFELWTGKPMPVELVKNKYFK